VSTASPGGALCSIPRRASSTGCSVSWTIAAGLTFLTGHTSGTLGGPKTRWAAPSRQPWKHHSWLPVKSLRVRTGCSLTQMTAWLK
jgi:hypothetical protein